jgi:hypothetical protein
VVVKAYQEKKKEAKGRNPQKLTLDETVDLILVLLETKAATIIIDALDECNSARRQDLLLALQKLIKKSGSLVRIFVSSRDNHDIVKQLAESPNVYVNKYDNGKDIESFVHFQVEEAIKEKRLLCGCVSEYLKNNITKTLIEKAEGM